MEVAEGLEKLATPTAQAKVEMVWLTQLQDQTFLVQVVAVEAVIQTQPKRVDLVGEATEAAALELLEVLTKVQEAVVEVTTAVELEDLVSL